MYVYILVYQSPLICVPNPSLILSFIRMAKVWVKFEDRRPIKITVGDGVDVDDLIKSYLHEVKVDRSPDLITATHNDGEELRGDRLVSEIETSWDDPIVLRKVIEVEEGMYSRTQKTFPLSLRFDVAINDRFVSVFNHCAVSLNGGLATIYHKWWPPLATNISHTDYSSLQVLRVGPTPPHFPNLRTRFARGGGARPSSFSGDLYPLWSGAGCDIGAP